MVRDRKKRLRLRMPIGKELKHKIGFEAAKNYDYDCIDLQRSSLYKTKCELNGKQKSKNEWSQNNVLYTPSEKEFEIVTKFRIGSRLSYFVDIIINYPEIWLCCNDDGSLFCSYDDQSRECVLVWPAKVYAELFLEYKDVKYLKPIKLHKFLERYIDELIESNVNILIFP